MKINPKWAVTAGLASLALLLSACGSSSSSSKKANVHDACRQ